MKSDKKVLLKVKSLSLSLGGRVLLKNVNFNVNRGEIVGVIGPNGSSKTVLLNAISGFYGSSCLGDIIFDGVSISKFKVYRRARIGVGRVFQNTGIFKDMSVLDNVLFAIESRERSLFCKIFSFSRNKDYIKEAKNFLKDVGLDSKADVLAGSLSGGQMRLLEIVRSLAFDSKLFLLDEPTTGVSPKMKKELSDVILRLKKLGKTVVIIEHDINFISKFCDNIIVLENGKLIMRGEPDELINSEILKNIYFGSD